MGGAVGSAGEREDPLEASTKSPWVARCLEDLEHEERLAARTVDAHPERRPVQPLAQGSIRAMNGHGSGRAPTQSLPLRPLPSSDTSGFVSQGVGQPMNMGYDRLYLSCPHGAANLSRVKPYFS